MAETAGGSVCADRGLLRKIHGNGCGPGVCGGDAGDFFLFYIIVKTAASQYWLRVIRCFSVLVPGS
jgi:hypothetical protein